MWLQGKPPKDIALLLYNLAHFKRRIVEKELSKCDTFQLGNNSSSLSTYGLC
jgi:hypothetical protein